jgi:hypothetical protein
MLLLILLLVNLVSHLALGLHYVILSQDLRQFPSMATDPMKTKEHAQYLLKTM